MKIRNFAIITGSMLAVALSIRFYSQSAARVEGGYSTGIYPAIGNTFRIIFGWLPFSIGDLLYGLAALWLLWRFIKMIVVIFKREVAWQSFINSFRRTTIIILAIYISFNLFWGINYNRQGIIKQLNLTTDTVSYADLKRLTYELVQKMNFTKQYLLVNRIEYPTNRQLFKKVQDAYAKAKDSLPFLQYSHISVKPSLWGWLGNYTGFTGYYNPFTGEAQVNTTVPKFLQPFVTCHEVAHQLGYAKENEANAVGYLAALYSNDSLLLYSTYFDMYNYAWRSFVQQSFLHNDTGVLNELQSQILPAVKADIKEMQDFFSRHKNPLEPLVRKGYSFYLRTNRQPKGMLAYDEVLFFLNAFYKKHGRI